MRKLRDILCALILCAGIIVTAAAVEGPQVLTRGELCMILVEELELTDYDISGMENPFTDLSPSAEYYNAVLVCTKLGLLDGDTNGTFRPRKTMTTEETARAICRAMGADPGPDADESEIMEWGEAHGIFTGAVGGTYDFASPEWFHFYLISPYVITQGDIQIDLSNGALELYGGADCTAVIQNGTTRRFTGGIVVRQSDSAATKHTVTVAGGEVELTLAGVNIRSEDTSPVFVGAGAHLALTLVGDNTLTATGSHGAGLAVPQGAELTVQGSGSLSAAGARNGAGIGGDSYWSGGGIITIQNGTITATGDRGAGIGDSDGCCGSNITIRGGTVTAGSNSGAGIGSGYNSEGASRVSIHGGTVNASSDSGAGIGGGSGGSGGTIAVYGGAVSAFSTSGAGIGGGCNGAGGTVVLSQATVTAGGGYFAIGGGHPDNAYGCDSITITDCTLELSHEEAQGAECQEQIFDLELPASDAALPGNALFQTTQARGESGLIYQWQCSTDADKWEDIPAQIAAQLSVPMRAELDGTYLRCRLTNGFGNVVDTQPVRIWVLAFAQHPESVEVNAGDPASLSAVSTCDNVVWSWERSYDNGISWNVVSGETYSTLLLNTAQGESAALYRCVITAGNGDRLASGTARVTVHTDRITYTVKYYHQTVDEAVYAVAEQSVLQGAAGVEVTAPVRTYAGFAENTGKGQHTGTVAQDGSLVLSRYYDRVEYTITLDTRGGSVLPDITARYGVPVGEPDAPTRYGHDFGGWFADAELTIPYIFTAMPVNGATVYARWVDKASDRGNEYEVQAILFRDPDSYELMDTIPDGNFMAEASITNLSSTQMDTVLFVSYAADGRMLGFHYAYANPDIGQTMTFGTLIENKNGQVGKVKVMVLSSLAGAQPLAVSMEK